MPDAPTPRGIVELISAEPGDQPLLAALLDSYAREFSLFHPVEFEADGSFVYPHLPSYWCEPGRFPFLIRMDGEIAGFVLVARQDSLSGEAVFDIDQFYVAPGFRRHGAGTEAAHDVWKRFPALWQVRVLDANQPAIRFWQSAVSRFTGKPLQPVSFTVGNEAWRRFSFDSRR